jgi:hypothetical protein
MSRATRRQKTEHQLRLLEEQFSENLIVALRNCAAGKVRIFGHDDMSIAAEPRALQDVLKSKEAETLLGQGDEIMRLRRQLGETEDFQPYQRYVYYRRLRSSNSPGEPKLAIRLLQELGTGNG